MIRSIAIIAALALLVVSCNNDKSTTSDTPVSSKEVDAPTGQNITLNAVVTGAGGLQAHIDYLSISSTESLNNAMIGGDGSFSFTLENAKPGKYRIRIGAKEMRFVLSGQESKVDLQAELSSLELFKYTVTGSPSAAEYQRIYRSFIEMSANEQDFANYIDTTQSPLVGWAIATEIDPRRYQFTYLTSDRILDIHKRANAKLASAGLGTEIVAAHQAFINDIKLTLSKQMVSVGSVPPDIVLPDPNGKTHSLSSLKGQVVLLDFWASWCRPCRFNNPELVRLYKKYKDQGFTVFSVSLDKNAQAWEQAILKDELSWEYHVSDLKFWNCEPAKIYGVNSIPQTFLLDRQGRIAALNPRGPQLEAAIQSLL